ncbi:hypothetical protein ACFQS1_19640 [Paractinoplanes rhizophilus]|uniref:Uncharacterized protein n=1 Tax=Paractinoplanes rhizophilus TaxID=1416877 RepID=A0ABW2HUB8_9ACTN
MSTPYVRFWYAITVAFVACLVTAVASVGYASWVNEQSQKRARQARIESDQRWCALLVDISRGQEDSPPRTESGKRFAAEIDKLRREFGCPEP